VTRALLAGLLVLANCSPPAATPAVETITRDVLLMGTRARLVTYSDTRDAGLATLDAALAELEATERELSTWMNDSSLSRLNRWPVGEPWPLDDRACDLMADLFALGTLTGGAFDPAIGRLTDLWGIHGAGRIPTDTELAAAREQSGLSRLQFVRKDCTVQRLADVAIDAGGFGKGEALDRVVAAGIAGPWLIDLGGQVAVAGTPPGGGRWPLALAHPVDRERELLALEIPPGSLATSAGSERDVEVERQRVGHILDPRAGAPATFAGSVSIWHISGLYADALSTALYVMGPKDGLAWATAQGLAAAYLVPDGDTVRIESTLAFEPFIVER
jgi:thiamine biosynthesis lipoprotein